MRFRAQDSPNPVRRAPDPVCKHAPAVRGSSDTASKHDRRSPNPRKPKMNQRTNHDGKTPLVKSDPKCQPKSESRSHPNPAPSHRNTTIDMRKYLF